MIILKHLTVERFRLLRELNLHFPQRGSILIQGPNEAGKSALLESIYFALYGEAMTTSYEKRSLDDLILYGTSTATITLTFSVGASELTVTRTIERGKGQNVVLYVRRLGMPTPEPITQLALANERIIAELGRMDSETLRNSCLIEQKALNRLEKLSGKERETTVRNLLGIEQFLQLLQQFQITEQDEAMIEECREQLRLAEIQAHIPVLSQQLEQVEIALDAVRVLTDLDEIDQQHNDILEQEQALENIQARRSTLKSSQGRVQQLKRADATLAQLIEAYDGIAEARRNLPELEQQIAELELREREELPALEKRVNELAELTRSFGTLQRMSNDLLTAVDTMKDLEREQKQYDEVQDDLKGVEEHVDHARKRVEEAQQALQDLEERRRAGRPQLEARLQRMRNLAERLGALHQLEEQYRHRVENRGPAEEHRAQLSKVQRDLRDSEQELARLETSYRQTQQQAEAQEARWRQLSISRQLGEWQRLKGLTQGLSEAEMQVRLAHQQQEKLTQAAIDARNAATTQMGISLLAAIFFIICFGFAVFEFLQGATLIAAISGIVSLLSLVGAAYCYSNYNKARQEERTTEAQMQEAMNKVSMTVSAREAAVRRGGSNEALALIEHEIRSLGGNVPRSLEEAQASLQQINDHGENLVDLHQQMSESHEASAAIHTQINALTAMLTTLRSERDRLEVLHQQEDWDNIEENIRLDQAAIERLQQEVTLLAGQEGLPLPKATTRFQSGANFDMYSSSPSGSFSSSSPSGTFSLSSPSGAFSSSSPSGAFSSTDGGEVEISELEALVESAIRTTEHEIAALDGKLDLAADLASQVKVHQDALDVLVARQRAIEERLERYQANSPMQQMERAREQQTAMRQALQSLQDSLRQRVKSLGVAFGQTAINSAEATSRKQLEDLQITLGSKMMLQEQHANYATILKEHRESLAEYYKQLAKYSNTLGGWIVPPNPFAEALKALRTRCQREIEEANEAGMSKELDLLQEQEGASKAKIALCHQEIEEAQARIVALLAQRGRPAAKSHSLKDLAVVWPLLSEYTVQDQERLAEQRVSIEDELTDLEEQELALSTRLQTGNTPLDLKQARARLDQQQRSYEAKKYGNQLIKEVHQRLLRKMLPRTEHYMHQILPLLTSGRYHDVHLVVEQEEDTISGGPWQMRVWDSGAGEYVPKSALSGGAADQLSLALRLAFAIAVLPRELNAAPGFVILDEPLSSFDRSRTQALVDVVTGDILSQHFEQIILISHSSAFDPAMFPYHIYMDNGMIVESNLPVVPGLPLQGLKETPLPIEATKQQPEHAVAE